MGRLPKNQASRRYHSFLPARIWIFWILFLVRGTFYSAMLPLWEGFVIAWIAATVAIPLLMLQGRAKTRM
jgi:hypothetical protein